MVKKVCPGNISQNLKAEFHNCPKCGYNVEIFTDEVRRKCPGCGTEVFRERVPSCIDWCPAAKECIGVKKWMELKGSKKVNGE